ncbi:acyltransferase [Selenomonas sputigena]|uniref:Acyltransferase n=1 Tax=Selenomonas sputigena TaxID=69823 RepID=A0ABV3X3U5_9FIRM
MAKQHLAAIEYIRGVSMLGVIGIHVGSQYLMNPASNAHLTALFEIATRFSVPIFFFISAFGIFYNMDLSKPFSYSQFLRKRSRAVVIPYLVWSLFYLVHDGWLYGVGFPAPLSLLSALFFGNAKYQLYFLVLLIWFYLLMPLWIPIVKNIGGRGLLLLFALQVAFDYFSSFNVAFNTMVYGMENPILKSFLLYRLNYWVMHYVFIFVIGGYLAVHFDTFREFMQKHRTGIVAFFAASLAALLGYYYFLLTFRGYTQMDAINTAHQLCPLGIVYTLAASLFFFTIFTEQTYPRTLDRLLSLLGRHSYFAYLAHPFFIGYMMLTLEHRGIIMTAPKAIAFYILTVVLTIAAAVVFRRLGEKIPFLNSITIGIYPKKNKRGSA